MGKIAETHAVTDQVGFSTLSTISAAGKFNRWMFETIAPFCEGEILEIGGGIGNISFFFLNDGQNLTITELHDEYCNILETQFCHFKNLRQVIRMDITDPGFDLKFSPLFGRFDSVFALNVLEHIGDPNVALANCGKLLKPDGNLITLAPAFQSFFNRFDRQLGHFIRFTKKNLCELMENNGFRVFHCRYFNAAGILGWWFSGSVMRKREIPDGQMSFFNFFVPLFRIIDKLTGKFIGLSVIAAGKKESNTQK